MVIAALIDVAGNVGYPLVFVFVGVESMGIPVPGETALITAALAASSGRLQIEFVIALAAAGAIVGDNIGYLIGRQGGRRVLERPGRFERQRREFLKRGEVFFERHGNKAVFFGRWIAGLRVWASWLAGINHMPWPHFLFWNALGGISWATSVGLAVYFAGNGAKSLITTLGTGALIAVGVVAVIVAAVWVVRRRRRRGSR
jgi:membrane protein DedA with SNARE-associated domain